MLLGFEQLPNMNGMSVNSGFMQFYFIFIYFLDVFVVWKTQNPQGLFA